jgi:predicted MPP superfamily phosphohydrolase
MQDAFQLKLELMENANKATIMNLQQDKILKYEESKQLKEELAKLRAELNHTTDNDLNYDSRKDNENSDINYDSESSGDEEEANNITIMNLKQEQARKDKENKQLREQLAHLRAELNHNADNDLNYDSPEDDNDDSYNTNCTTESSDDEEHDNCNSRHIIHQNTSEQASNEIYADPNYNSSDNEDPRNDLYLD